MYKYIYIYFIYIYIYIYFTLVYLTSIGARYVEGKRGFQKKEAYFKPES